MTNRWYITSWDENGLAVDSVLDSLEPKFILIKNNVWLCTPSSHHQKGRFSLLASNRTSVAFHTSSGIMDTIGPKSYEQTLMIDIRSAQ